MAHCLVSFAQTCDQICTRISNTDEINSEKRSPMVLTEVFPDGKVCSQTVDERLIEAYIERDFVDGTSPVHSTIKLVHSIRRDHIPDGRLLPLPLASLMLKRLAPWIRMPLVFPDVLAASTAMFLDAVPEVPGTTAQSPRQVSLEHLSFILQSVPGGVWSSCFGASFTYNFKNRCMYVFLQTYEKVDSQPFSEAIDLGRFGLDGHSPFLIPSAIVKHHLETRVRSLDKKKDEIFQLECTMGLRRDFLGFVDITTIDYTDMSRAINTLNSHLAWTMHFCKRTKRLLDFLDSVAIRYGSQAKTNGIPQDEILETEQLLINSHAYLRSLNQGLADCVEYLTKRLQALSQSVYSGIAQRDSANSISIAKTSTQLAETSQQVAISTSRDSAVMRVITAVTIVFLPGTFTATFFSTAFFDFNAGVDDHVYSPWVWIYFVFTMALTAIVMSATWYLWRSKEKEITRQGNERSDTKESSRSEEV